MKSSKRGKGSKQARMATHTRSRACSPVFAAGVGKGVGLGGTAVGTAVGVGVGVGVGTGVGVGIGVTVGKRGDVAPTASSAWGRAQITPSEAMATATGSTGVTSPAPSDTDQRPKLRLESCIDASTSQVPESTV